jgi:hypothetical protein
MRALCMVGISLVAAVPAWSGPSVFDTSGFQIADAGAPAAGGGEAPKEPEKPAGSTRRALPAPLPSPPFPSGDWQGYPLIGIPPSDTTYAVMDQVYKWRELYGVGLGEAIMESRIKLYGWVNGSGNWSSSKHSNAPMSYWIVPNRLVADQVCVRLEREADTAQDDHVDVGFRATLLWGQDYRYMIAGGIFSDQLLEHNLQYGFDTTEVYADVYIPRIAEGLTIRLGRWIACPDIETQFAPDNYMASHSILFTFDTYTQTGLFLTMMLSKNWIVQAGIHAGTDMAPWYKGATPTGVFGVRWVSTSSNDSVYLVLNAINGARFRRFEDDGQKVGHDNFNYLVGTWQHKFSDAIHTKVEAYFMWQRDAVVGGTPSVGEPRSFGGGGGIGADIPGMSRTFGVVNYTMFRFSDADFITVRNEVWCDHEGERSGIKGTYSSHAIGLTHNFSSYFQVRPEVGYYRNWSRPAFDLGTKKGQWVVGVDATFRF